MVKSSKKLVKPTKQQIGNQNLAPIVSIADESSEWSDATESESLSPALDNSRMPVSTPTPIPTVESGPTTVSDPTDVLDFSCGHAL